MPSTIEQHVIMPVNLKIDFEKFEKEWYEATKELKNMPVIIPGWAQVTIDSLPEKEK